MDPTVSQNEPRNLQRHPVGNRVGRMKEKEGAPGSPILNQNQPTLWSGVLEPVEGSGESSPLPPFRPGRLAGASPKHQPA